MKKIIYILSATIVMAAVLSSCNSFLDEEMKGDYSSNNMYTTEDQAELALNGVYNAATYSINLWKFGDIPSDDAVKGGNAGDQSDLEYIDEYNVQNDNGAVSEFWQNTYETISRANNVIYGVSNAGLDCPEIVGQARFLRAFSYFQLVNIFGSVPLKLEPQTSSDKINVPLSSVDDIYSSIESDLEYASATLPVQATETGRVTKGAALGLLAKAYLYQEDYATSLIYIDSLKNLDVYSLDEYSNLFILGNESSPETIFAICFLSDQVPNIGNSLNQWFAPLVENGYYFNNPTQDWLDTFDETQVSGEDDLRIDVSIGREGKAWLNDNVFDSSWSTTGFLVKKHNQPLSEVPAGTKGDGGLAYIYLRYADILLMEAECQTELNHPELAEEPLNEVRNRAGLASVSGLTQSQMRTLVRKERRKELGFEFHRFFDLMRWGEDAAIEALGSDFPWTEPRYYFPIPQAELDANTAL